MHYNWLSLSFTALLCTTDVFITSVSASTLAPRKGGDPKDLMRNQVNQAINIVSKQPGSNMKNSGFRETKNDKELLAHLKRLTDAKQATVKKGTKVEPRKVKVAFFEFYGTKGDIGKSLYYLDEIEKSKILKAQSKRLARIMDVVKAEKTFEVKFGVDCEAKKYLTDEVKKVYAQDIAQCGEDRQGFKDFIKRTIQDWKPDAIIQGHAIERLYDDEQPDPDDPAGTTFFKGLQIPIQKCVKDDTCFTVKLKSYTKTIEDVKRKDKQGDEYSLTKNDITLVGQTPDYYAGVKLELSKQVLIGRAQTPLDDSTKNPQKLTDWLKADDTKKVMYLSSGGKVRPSEKDKDKITPVFKTFLDKTLKDEKYKDWKFIVMHYTQGSDADKQGVLTDDDRVFHIWYPSNLMDLWSNAKIKIVVHHCGKGSFDDAILSKKAQICMPQIGFGKDMVYWAAKLKELNIGVGVPPITFKDPDSKEYMGEQEPYPEASMKEFFKAFETLDGPQGDEMAKNTLPLIKVLTADTAGELTLKVIKRWANAFFKRHAKDKKFF
ncbi:hypothetical protein BU24DRAFT_422280 [Aaosphaeria arxii CBS 175.79]|uniref:Glycosyltransferase family 1 protein n=1 Tax=Aaosphaeria arxii CBS 175.79 TaxID=1450172 RepID=A0A6A5XSP3_9PLEO|nr:uncharacterized protein BU24DRAFT_422280 [Aaosphaeria arxii CBS 175.79]KAF2015963.1 hypothetical protein BU24DRAFT_422280 [Aaosphaeria arxii CBS 175.79]